MKKICCLFLVVVIHMQAFSFAFAQGVRQKDSTVVSVGELSDVEGNEWAYNAVRELVEKYDVLEGYPDGTFRGETKGTRFELAAAVYDLATYFSDEVALDREDLAKLADLLDEFSGEIKAIQGRVDQIEQKLATVETNVGVLQTKTTQLEGTVNDHSLTLEEYAKRLAYAERSKGFLIERLFKGVIVDVRDIYRGIFSTTFTPVRNILTKDDNQ
ncbi:MAG: S-layer homology domain-containing protein [Candidatus Melainabacteria bacterium]|nr:S-layer homology domain-containing protein [Candidatus Melainabacteria bacterium]